ncbi:hypothetical protein [Pseudoduganella lutea]|uniref:Uncharacterized protein n=1 Tax=Pseudoduganella lutea TaxID=321985 RepID=A0A4P6KX45_9BURK|nr:hypothetical protein [Pseudoduganella lutea]QBE63550.1 hypothetical protein EWM63_11675 [Pseudoduganella lutea]
MSREVIADVIARKRELYHQEYTLQLREFDMEEKFLFAGEAGLPEQRKQMNELADAFKFLHQKLKRAHLFGLQHTKALPPGCTKCYIDSGELRIMAQPASSPSGPSLFTCTRCGHRLRMTPATRHCAVGQS